ncbi:MAG: GNAT family protein [Planctomycetota bacterium]
MMTEDGRVVTLRTLEQSDAETVLEYLAEEAVSSPHAVTQPDEVETDPEKEREWIRSRAEAAGELALGAFDEHGTCIGTLTFTTYRQRRVRHRGQFGIGVRKAWRSQGIGRAMIESMLDWARDHEYIEVVSLGVFHTNKRAIELYRSLGFQEEARRREFFRTDHPGGEVEYADDVLMTLRVKPRATTTHSNR